MLAGTSDGTAEPWVSRNTGVPLRLPAISTYVSPAAGFPFVVPDGSREGTDAPAAEGGADAADDDPLLRSPTTPPATRPRPTPITNADTVKLATTTIGRCSRIRPSQPLATEKMSSPPMTTSRTAAASATRPEGLKTPRVAWRPETTPTIPAAALKAVCPGMRLDRRLGPRLPLTGTPQDV